MYATRHARKRDGARLTPHPRSDSDSTTWEGLTIMMGPSHALSGAAAWLAGSWALSEFAHYHQTPLQMAVGTAVCAGGALLPDMDLSGRVTTDKGGATVAHTFGRASLFLAEILEKLSLGIYDVTRLKHDPKRHNGHRTFTHTLPFAVGVGVLTTWGCAAGGKWAVLGILFFMMGLALRGLFHTWAAKLGWIPITLIAAAAAYGTYRYLPSDRGYPLIGLAVGVGCVVHLLGDIITREGIPILWPIPTGLREWRMIGVPNGIAVKVGGRVEAVLRGAFVVIAVLATAALAAPALMHRFDIQILSLHP
jgi:membrane-bound metal-dependent hydrolase YbcI (DUF457 family)